MKHLAVAALAALIASAGCATAPDPRTPQPAESFSLAAEYIVPEGTTFPALGKLSFGGISGLAPVRGRRELLAISDDRVDSRILRLEWSGEGSSFAVNAIGAIQLQGAPGSTMAIDPEGIAITDTGTILVSTEGLGEEEPRTPPSINEYAPDGRFLSELPVPARFFPNERGTLTTGVRRNGGFESLTMTPDFRAIYTANELPLAQDADDAVVAQGAGGQVRILRYARSEAALGYAPQQQFAYDIDPLAPLPFTPQVVVNGLVELLAIGDGDLLALERAYAQSDDPQQSLNRIRIYRISLRDATDVTKVASLKTGGQKAVRKTLVADLNAMAGLSPSLRNLDNFEAMAWVPAGPGRTRMLMVASDDNFNGRQVTAFLLLSPRR
jgi:3-phytase